MHLLQEVPDERVGRVLAIAVGKLGTGAGEVIAALPPKRAAIALGRMGDTLAAAAINQMEAEKVFPKSGVLLAFRITL